MLVQHHVVLGSSDCHPLVGELSNSWAREGKIETASMQLATFAGKCIKFGLNILNLVSGVLIQIVIFLLLKLKDNFKMLA